MRNGRAKSTLILSKMRRSQHFMTGTSSHPLKTSLIWLELVTKLLKLGSRKIGQEIFESDPRHPRDINSTR